MFTAYVGQRPWDGPWMLCIFVGVGRLVEGRGQTFERWCTCMIMTWGRETADSNPVIKITLIQIRPGYLSDLFVGVSRHSTYGWKEMGPSPHLRVVHHQIIYHN